MDKLAIDRVLKTNSSGRDSTRFRPPHCIEFDENGLHVMLDCAFADIKNLSYLFIASTVGDILQDLEFARRKFRARHGFCESGGNLRLK
jgi:hypothetical protein